MDTKLLKPQLFFVMQVFDSTPDPKDLDSKVNVSGAASQVPSMCCNSEEEYNNTLKCNTHTPTPLFIHHKRKIFRAKENYSTEGAARISTKSHNTSM